VLGATGVKTQQQWQQQHQQQQATPAGDHHALLLWLQGTLDTLFQSTYGCNTMPAVDHNCLIALGGSLLLLQNIAVGSSALSWAPFQWAHSKLWHF
jgi:hypothetical protein